jgi:hypothetical protein
MLTHLALIEWRQIKGGLEAQPPAFPLFTRLWQSPAFLFFAVGRALHPEAIWQTVWR